MHGRSRSPRLGREGRFQNDQLLAPCRSSGCLWQGSHTPINMIEKILPRREEMHVRARKHVRNEGSRRFKSTPLRQRVWLLRQSPGNSTKCPPLWSVLSPQPVNWCRRAAAFGMEGWRVRCRRSAPFDPRRPRPCLCSPKAAVGDLGSVRPRLLWRRPLSRQKAQAAHPYRGSRLRSRRRHGADLQVTPGGCP
jgi:hypothetical protein